MVADDDFGRLRVKGEVDVVFQFGIRLPFCQLGGIAIDDPFELYGVPGVSGVEVQVEVYTAGVISPIAASPDLR